MRCALPGSVRRAKECLYENWPSGLEAPWDGVSRRRSSDVRDGRALVPLARLAAPAEKDSPSHRRISIQTR